MDEIYFETKLVESKDEGNEDIVLLNPKSDSSSGIISYRFDMSLIDKDISVKEISEDLHFVYCKDVERFFEINQDTKVTEIPQRIWALSFD